jgi:hypothetical protein
MKTTVHGLAILCALGLAGLWMPQSAFSGACQEAPELCCDTDAQCGADAPCIEDFGLCQSTTLSDAPLGSRLKLCDENLDCAGKCKYSTQTGWPGPDAPPVDCTVPEDCSPSTNGYVCQLDATPCNTDADCPVAMDVCVLDVCLDADVCIQSYDGRCQGSFPAGPLPGYLDGGGQTPCNNATVDDDCLPGEYCVQPGGCADPVLAPQPWCYAGLPPGRCTDGGCSNCDMCSVDADCYACSGGPTPGAHCTGDDIECGSCSLSSRIPCVVDEDCPPFDNAPSNSGVCDGGPNVGQYCWPLGNTLTVGQDCPPADSNNGECDNEPTTCCQISLNSNPVSLNSVESGGEPEPPCEPPCNPACPPGGLCVQHYTGECGPKCVLQTCTSGTCNTTPMCATPGQSLGVCCDDDTTLCRDSSDCDSGNPCCFAGTCGGGPKFCSNDPTQECEEDMDCGGACVASGEPCTSADDCPLEVCSLHQNMPCLTDDDCDWDCWVDGMKTGIDCPPGDDAYCEVNPLVDCDPNTEFCICLKEESCVLSDACAPSGECVPSGQGLDCEANDLGMARQKCIDKSNSEATATSRSCYLDADCAGCSETENPCEEDADCRSFCQHTGDWDCTEHADCPLVCQSPPYNPCTTNADCPGNDCDEQTCVLQICAETCDTVGKCWDPTTGSCTNVTCYTDSECELAAPAGENWTCTCDYDCGLGSCDISVAEPPDSQCGAGGPCESCVEGGQPPPTCNDADRDGYGSPGNAGCTAGSATDCNDSNRDVNPGAPEGPLGDPTCADGLDNDCNGSTDGDDLVNCQVCTDSDGDGYGSPGHPGCSAGSATDCNDSRPAVNPGAVEGPAGNATCVDGLDNDCDGFVDGEEPDCVPTGPCSAA